MSHAQEQIDQRKRQDGAEKRLSRPSQSLEDHEKNFESTPKSEIPVIFFQFGSGAAIFNKSHIPINYYI